MFVPFHIFMLSIIIMFIPSELFLWPPQRFCETFVHLQDLLCVPGWKGPGCCWMSVSVQDVSLVEQIIQQHLMARLD